MRMYIEELSRPMVLVGYLGQLLFFSRFLVQWIASERQKRPVVPSVFWYLSAGGGLLLLCYALWRKDQVIVMGQLVGLFVYIRNLVLHHRHQGTLAAGQPS